MRMRIQGTFVAVLFLYLPNALAMKPCSEMNAKEHGSPGFRCATPRGNIFTREDYLAFGDAWLDEDWSHWSGVSADVDNWNPAHADRVDSVHLCKMFGGYLPDQKQTLRLLGQFMKKHHKKDIGSAKVSDIDWDSYLAVFPFSSRHVFWIRGDGADATASTVFSVPSVARGMLKKNIDDEGSVLQLFSVEAPSNIHTVRCTSEAPATPEVPVTKAPEEEPVKTDLASVVTPELVEGLKAERCSIDDKKWRKKLKKQLLPELYLLYAGHQYLSQPHLHFHDSGFACIYDEHPSADSAFFIEQEVKKHGDFVTFGSDYHLDPTNDWVYYVNMPLSYRNMKEGATQVEGDMTFFELSQDVYLFGVFTGMDEDDTSPVHAALHPHFYAVGIYFDGN